MADELHEKQALRGFDELCDRSFTPDFSLKRARSSEHTIGEAPFTQHGTSREWMAAEAGRLYSFSGSTDGMYSPDSIPSRTSRDVTHTEVFAAAEPVPQLGKRAGKRRASSFQAFRTKFRRLSNTVAGAIPVRMPRFMKKKTSTFESMEGWSWSQAGRRSERAGHVETIDVEARMMSVTMGIC